LREAADQSGIVLANVSAGPAERRTAVVAGRALLGVGVAVVPFGRMHLPGIRALKIEKNHFDGSGAIKKSS